MCGCGGGGWHKTVWPFTYCTHFKETNEPKQIGTWVCLNSLLATLAQTRWFLSRGHANQVFIYTVFKYPQTHLRSRGGRLSWTLKLAQKRSWAGRWSWAAKVGLLSLQVVPQQQCNGHCPCDSASANPVMMQHILQNGVWPLRWQKWVTETGRSARSDTRLSVLLLVVANTLLPSLSRTRTRVCTCTHARTHTRKHTHTHTPWVGDKTDSNWCCLRSLIFC